MHFIVNNREGYEYIEAEKMEVVGRFVVFYGLDTTLIAVFSSENMISVKKVKE